MQTLTFKAQEIRVREQNGTTWFCAVDIARILGYKNAAQAVTDNIDPKHICQISLGKKGRPPVFVSEPGLYQLVLKSKLPAAIEFQDWVCDQADNPVFGVSGYLLSQASISNGTTVKNSTTIPSG